ncbi:MAG: cytochrome c biogenesis protein CcsA [Verrucomicrobia bacterium]|nr:cytochrome c biogenesis protein CcsA [Verrucomicrobiota bacterium]
MKKWLPFIVAAAMALWVLSTVRAPADKDFAYTEFGRLPAVFNGRCQPLDSVARNSLLQIREKQAANIEPWKGEFENPKLIPAIEWLAAVMMKPEVADAWQVFRIDHPELVSLLKLPEKDKEKQSDGKHYSWNQMQPSLDALEKETKRASKVEGAHRTPFDQAVLKLQQRLMLYTRLKNTLQPQDAQDWPRELAEYEKLIVPGMAAMHAQQAGKEHDKAVLEKFFGFLQRFDTMSGVEPPLVVPPHHPERSRDGWMRMGEALMEMARGGKLHEAARHYAAMAGAFRSGKPDEFNRAVDAYRQTLAPKLGPELTKADRECFFNRLQPFYISMVIYVLAFLLACASWVNMSEPLRRSAVYLVALAFIVHTAGLVFRMWLESRPPVTNLYSSAIFIGWGAVVLGMVLERFYRDGIGTVVASAVGFITLIIAHHLSLGGDTMEMMRAVLDTNFWLATHVVTITIGYSSAFVAGFLAVIYVLRGAFTRTLSEATGAALSRMVYGIVCFATLFSFVGTVLGGIWADQSWGRFWGWDPKENGALIIVLWNALILHARWSGTIRERGLMNMAIAGNIVTSWSWFGVNMLGIGLHSYGFMDAAFWWLMAFVVSQLALIAIGLLPDDWWLSLRSRPPSSRGGSDGKRGKDSNGDSKLASA